MSTALARHDEIDLMALGQVFAKSGFFADSRDAAQAVVKIQAGRELGFPPVASMTGVYIVKGKVCLSANMIAAAIKRSGKYTYKVVRLDDQGCALEFFEGKESLGVSEFTIADAKRQGTQNIDRFPRNMLFARALSNGAKWHTPDIFGGPIYTPDELGEAVDENGDMTNHRAPAPASRQLPAANEAASGIRGEEAPKAELPSTPEDKAFCDSLRGSFDARGISAKLAVAAINRRYSVESLRDLTADQRVEVVDAVAAGKLDKFQISVPAAV